MPAPETRAAEIEAGRAVLAITQGDLTRFDADALVNAANAQLAGGGGVDGAIHAAAGPDVMAELRRRYPEGCPTGNAVISGAGRLPARWVVHAVGPIWRGGGGGEASLLASAYRSAVRLADEAGARTIALAAISAGIYGYPVAEAAAIGLSTVRESLARAANLERATFVLRGEETYAAFADVIERLRLAGERD